MDSRVRVPKKWIDQSPCHNLDSVFVFWLNARVLLVSVALKCFSSAKPSPDKVTGTGESSPTAHA
jgi:hypothetical protein